MKIRDWPIITFYLLSFLLTLMVYSRLPDSMPIHWNVAGQPDNYAPKIMAVFLTLLIPLFIYGLMLAVQKKEHYERFKGTYKLISNVLIIFFLGLHWLVISISLGYKLDVTFWVPGAVGLLFIILGSHLGQIPQNNFVGIRTPWTLANNQVWQCTHRLAGPIWVLGGIVCFGSIFLPNVIMTKLFLGVVVLLILIPTIYSYWLFKRIS